MKRLNEQNLCFSEVNHHQQQAQQQNSIALQLPDHHI
jgi:hypothetical protein